MKKIVSILLALVMMMGLLAGCGSGETQDSNPPSTQSGDEKTPSGNEGGGANSDLKGELVFAIWDNNLMEYIEANDMEAKFQEQYPNATIEVEKIKDDS